MRQSQDYTQYTFTVTATGSTSTLEFDARQDPCPMGFRQHLGDAGGRPLRRRLRRSLNHPARGDLNAGKTVTLTLNMSESVTVNTAGGTPTLTLNDGGTATYTSGSGSALTFSYTVALGRSNVASLRRRRSISTARPSRTAPAMPPTCH